jgi:hypothetical protein
MTMGEVIEKMNEKGLRRTVKVIVGGCPVTQEFADEIARYYSCCSIHRSHCPGGCNREAEQICRSDNGHDADRGYFGNLDSLLGKQRGSANHEGFQRKFIDGHYSDDWILIRSLVFFQSRFEAGTNVIGWVYGVGCNPGYDDLYQEYLWIDLTFFASGLKKKNAGQVYLPRICCK